jgi:hypothetical protein
MRAGIKISIRCGLALMPALIGRYNYISDDSRELFPLLECLGYISAAYDGSLQVSVNDLYAAHEKRRRKLGKGVAVGGRDVPEAI